MAEEVFSQRTTTCGSLTKADNGAKVVLNGWVHRDRNHGALHFINLRDRYGITQVVVDDDASNELQAVANELHLVLHSSDRCGTPQTRFNGQPRDDNRRS